MNEVRDKDGNLCHENSLVMDDDGNFYVIEGIYDFSTGKPATVVMRLLVTCATITDDEWNPAEYTKVMT